MSGKALPFRRRLKKDCGSAAVPSARFPVFFFSYLVVPTCGGQDARVPKAAEAETPNFATSQLRNYPKLSFHPYLPYLTDRRSLPVGGIRKWTAGESEP